MFDLSPDHLDEEFPVRRNLVYFNHAAQSPLPRRVAAAIEKQVENAKTRGAADWDRWVAGVDQTREKAAALIGALRSEIAFVPSTSWGINLVAQSYDWKEGDNVVGDDMEFPSIYYPWRLLAKRGVEYRLARNHEGRVTVDDIAAMVDARTRVVAISWVAFHNGYVYPLDEIGAFCRERSILLVVDAIQGLGALPLNVRRLRDRRARGRSAQVASGPGSLRDLLCRRKRARAPAAPVRRLVEPQEAGGVS